MDSSTFRPLITVLIFFICVFLLVRFAHADCPWDREKNAYDCTGTIQQTNVVEPGMISPGQYDARSSSMIQQDNGWGLRRRGGCAAVIKSGNISHYDCTTRALQAVPETIIRRTYMTYWEKEDARDGCGDGRAAETRAERVERCGGTALTPGQMADRLVPQ